MLSDSKYVAVDLRGSTDKVIKLVEDQIINNHGLLKVEKVQETSLGIKTMQQVNEPDSIWQYFGIQHGTGPVKWDSAKVVNPNKQ